MPEKTEKDIQENKRLFELINSDKPWVKSDTPTKDEKVNGGRIEDWSVYGNMVYGVIYDDPRGYFRSGDSIRTSYIANLDEENGVLETRNTIYKLGNKSKI